MRRQHVVIGLALWAVLVGFPERAFGCGCGAVDPSNLAAVRDDFLESVSESDGVFVGRVYALDSLRATLRVERSWKEEFSNSVTLPTGTTFNDDGTVSLQLCAPEFELHRSYLMTVYRDAVGVLQASKCATWSDSDMRRRVAWLDEWQRQTGLAPLEISGVVTDSAGHPLEGAVVRLGNRDGISARADGRGEFTIGGLAPGSYDVVAELQGFRRARVTVSLPKHAKQNLTLVMRVGLLESPLYVLPDDDDAVRQATAIARVRLDGFATDEVSCDDLVVLAAPHHATVVDVWKGKLPRAIQIWEDGVGSCVESDGAVVKAASAASRHLIGSEYVVLLTGSAPRFGGLGPGSRAFRIQGASVETNGFLDLPATTELQLFKKRLEDLSR